MCATLPSSPADLQAFLLVHALHTLPIDARPRTAFEHARELPMPPAWALRRELVQRRAQPRVRGALRLTAVTRARESGEATRPALRNFGGFHRMRDGRPPLCGRHHFFPKRSFTT
jgi:hypothetical protein